MAASGEFDYVGYQQTVADVSLALENAGKVMRNLDLQEQAEQAKEVYDRLTAQRFSVGIMGEFKRGKSTVINALLGKKIAPADVKPASATLNRIIYGTEPNATILYKDGHKEDVPVENLAAYITKITDEYAATAENVDQAIVQYPCQFCKNNVEIIDTPGLNDDERMEVIAESVIPTLDAVVFVVAANVPFGMSEAKFVRNKLMTSNVSRLIVIVNQIDLIDEEDRDRLVDGIKSKIVDELLGRIAAVHSKESGEYRDAAVKLTDLRMYPISAKQALQGRLKNQENLVQESGILLFEDRLQKLLTEERGKLEIYRAVSVLTSLLAKGQEALSIRYEALEVSEQEFLKNKQDAEEEMLAIRKSKKEEKDRITARGGEIKREIDKLLEEKYDNLDTVLEAFVHNYPISAEQVRTDAAKEALRQDMSVDMESAISDALDDYAEQINVFLQREIGSEALKIEKYMGEICENIEAMNSKLQGKSKMSTAAVIGVDGLSNVVSLFFSSVLSNSLVGLGGMIKGYQAVGVKGAATGLVGGVAGATVAAFAIGALTGGIGLIPFALLTGTAGTMGGSFLTNLIWKKQIAENKINEFRKELQGVAKKTVRELREKSVMENWARKQIEAQIDMLKEHVEKETESVISATEKTLNDIAKDIASAKVDKERKIKDYDEWRGILSAVSDQATAIMARINVAEIPAT